MTRIAITGGNGVLGTKLVELLLADQGNQILSLSNVAQKTESRAGFATVWADIRDGQNVIEVMRKFEPEMIIHTAAYTNVDGAETERELCRSVNVDGTTNLASAAAQIGAKLVYLSTDYVFDGMAGPYDEEAEPHPLGWYGATKLMGESAVQATCDDFLICRTTTLYGCARGVRQTFVPWLLAQLQTGKPVSIVADQWSNPTLADDLAMMIRALLTKSATGLFNTMGQDYVSRYDFALQVADFFGLDKSLISRVSTVSLQQAAVRPLLGGGKIDKLVEVTGYHPMTVREQLMAIKQQLENGQAN